MSVFIDNSTSDSNCPDNFFLITFDDIFLSFYLPTAKPATDKVTLSLIKHTDCLNDKDKNKRCIIKQVN